MKNNEFIKSSVKHGLWIMGVIVVLGFMTIPSYVVLATAVLVGGYGIYKKQWDLIAGLVGAIVLLFVLYYLVIYVTLGLMSHRPIK